MIWMCMIMDSPAKILRSRLRLYRVTYVGLAYHRTLIVLVSWMYSNCHEHHSLGAFVSKYAVLTRHTVYNAVLYISS